MTAVADFNGQPGGGAASTCRSDADDQYASFSNFAVHAADQNHTIAAPGVCIHSTYMLGMYDDTLSGTSMASPHVDGHGRALHRDGRLHGYAVADHLEVAGRRPGVQPGNADLRIQRRPGPPGQRPLLRLAGSRRRLLSRTEDE